MNFFFSDMQRKQQKKHERGEERDVTVDEDFFGEDIVFIIKISFIVIFINIITSSPARSTPRLPRNNKKNNTIIIVLTTHEF